MDKAQTEDDEDDDDSSSEAAAGQWPNILRYWAQVILLQQPKLVSYLETVPPLLLIKRAHSAFNAFPITQIHTHTHTSHTAGSNTGFPHNRIPKLHEAHTTFPYYSHCSMAIRGRKNTQVWNPAKHTRQEHPPTHISILIRFDHHPLGAKKALRLSLSLSLSQSVTSTDS
jgi:hypothetical protein